VTVGLNQFYANKKAQAIDYIWLFEMLAAGAELTRSARAARLTALVNQPILKRRRFKVALLQTIEKAAVGRPFWIW